MSDTPPTDHLLALRIAGQAARAIARTGLRIGPPDITFQAAAHPHPRLLMWESQVGVPEGDGLWLWSGLPGHQGSWRRLTEVEAVAFADGRMPWDPEVSELARRANGSSPLEATREARAKRALDRAGHEIPDAAELAVWLRAVEAYEVGPASDEGPGERLFKRAVEAGAIDGDWARIDADSRALFDAMAGELLRLDNDGQPDPAPIG